MGQQGDVEEGPAAKPRPCGVEPRFGGSQDPISAPQNRGRGLSVGDQVPGAARAGGRGTSGPGQTASAAGLGAGCGHWPPAGGRHQRLTLGSGRCTDVASWRGHPADRRTRVCLNERARGDSGQPKAPLPQNSLELRGRCSSKACGVTGISGGPSSPPPPQPLQGSQGERP